MSLGCPSADLETSRRALQKNAKIRARTRRWASTPTLSWQCLELGDETMRSDEAVGP
jgi:hypothetical protein